jgi:hypothetical protein
MAKRKLFLTLFRAEIEDNIEGIEGLAAALRERFSKGEITNYVYSENEALLGHVLAELKKLLPLVDGLDKNAYADAAALAQSLESMLQTEVKESGDSGLVREIIGRKIKKVLKYIAE